MWNALTAALAAVVATALAAPAAAVPYDIVYVRQPRFGDSVNTAWPEVAHPASIDPGADLMLLHADGSEERLVAGGIGAVTDPFVSFDAQWVYYSFFYDVRPQGYNSQRGLPYLGADIFRINLQTGAIEQLTFGEFTPNTGAGHFDETNPVDPPNGYDSLGYGVLNLGPAPVAGGKVAFSSNRNGFVPPHGLTNPTLQLFVMDEDGKNVTQIAPMNIGSALHPTPLRDGRLMFSSLESQGLRDERMWGIWSIWPDGRHWGPVVSAFHSGQAFHFTSQLSNDDLVVVDYYNLNNNGFGAIYRLPVRPPAGTPAFYSAFPDDNPPIDQTVGAGFDYPFTMPFTPWGMYSITPFTHGNDEAAPVGANGVRVGKFTHPSGAPNGDLLVVWSPGPCNNQDRPSPLPYYDGGIYLIPGGNIVKGPTDLVLIKNDPAYNEAWPRAVVPYRAVHGQDQPDVLSWLPNDGTLHPALPPGTPYGLVGTSSVYKRESFPGVVSPWADTFDGLDAFNTYENDQSSNWVTQGSDAGKYSNADIWAIRIVGMEPNTHRSYGPNGGPSGGSLFASFAAEKLRILGEIPLRKWDAGGQPILDPEGNPDTSFLVKVPADSPFTFQTLDRNGMVLNMAQTWHQVRPGEVRNDCGGCHAHSQLPLPFAGTYAARPDYQVADLSKTTPLLTKDAQGNPALHTVNAPLVTVEFYRDIRPILQRSCVPCHTKNAPNPPGALVLDDYTSPDGMVPGDYARLADDQAGQWGYPSLVTPYGWRQTNASRYVRMFQSRRSLLMWKIFGARLDGWTNADHPTETTPGDASTLPAGADVNDADLDFTGLMMPPPGSGVPPLSDDEKMTLARWIDLGAPINWGDGGTTAYGWFLDDLRPSLNVSSPRPGANPAPLTTIRLGAADAHSGVDWTTLSITADFAVNGRPAGAQLADLAAPIDDGIYALALSPPVAALADGTLNVAVADRQGNITRVVRYFAVLTGGPTATASPTGLVAATPTPKPSSTAVPPTASTTATRTASSTAIPPTASRTATRTASFTAAPPTASRTATRTASFTAPPATASATATRTRTNTFTLPPATQTPTQPANAAVSGHIHYYQGDRPVAGVTFSADVSTDVNGAYAMNAAVGSTLTLMPHALGGTAGAISALDAAYVLQAVAGTRTFDAVQALACDTTGDGTLSALDATRILQLVVGMQSRLPVATACGSDFVFFPAAGAAPNQSVVQPSLTASTCQAGAISLAPLIGPATTQDFRAAVFGDCTGNWQPPSGAAAALTASSAARVAIGRVRPGPDSAQRLPIAVRGAAEFSALELTLELDPGVDVRAVQAVGDARGALVQFAAPAAGQASVALASSRPLRSARLLVELGGQPTGDRRRVLHSLSARVDEQPAQRAR